MTINDLLEKLEEVRFTLDNCSDENARDAFDTVNMVISDLENDGIEGNEGYKQAGRVW